MAGEILKVIHGQRCSGLDVAGDFRDRGCARCDLPFTAGAAPATTEEDPQSNHLQSAAAGGQVERQAAKGEEVKIGTKATGLLACALLCAAVSCEFSSTPPAPPAATFTENAERARLGLRVVQTNWFFCGEQLGEEDWKISKTDGNIAKRIYRYDHKLSWEDDCYYSGKSLPPGVSRTGAESVLVHYDYDAREFAVEYIGVDPSIISLFDKAGPTLVTTNDLSVADTILKKWGLSRL
jgi:hypothetical protein